MCGPRQLFFLPCVQRRQNNLVCGGLALRRLGLFLPTRPPSAGWHQRRRDAQPPRFYIVCALRQVERPC